MRSAEGGEKIGRPPPPPPQNSGRVFTWRGEPGPASIEHRAAGGIERPAASSQPGPASIEHRAAGGIEPARASSQPGHRASQGIEPARASSQPGHRASQGRRASSIEPARAGEHRASSGQGGEHRASSGQGRRASMPGVSRVGRPADRPSCAILLRRFRAAQQKTGRRSPSSAGRPPGTRLYFSSSIDPMILIFAARQIATHS